MGKIYALKRQLQWKYDFALYSKWYLKIYNFRLQCTYKSIFSLNVNFQNIILNHQCGGSASFGNTPISLWQDLQPEFFYCGFHPVLCKALVITQVLPRAITVWREQWAHDFEPQLFDILSTWNFLWGKFCCERERENCYLVLYLHYFIKMSENGKNVYLAGNMFGSHGFNIMKTVWSRVPEADL